MSCNPCCHGVWDEQQQLLNTQSAALGGFAATVWLLHDNQLHDTSTVGVCDYKTGPPGLLQDIRSTWVRLEAA